MKTIDWPPVISGGRMQMVTGAAATRVMVMQTLGDLQQNPFNADDLSLGDVTFRVQGPVRARVANSIRRLSKLISVQTIIESTDSSGVKTVVIEYTDRETREKGRSTIDG